VNRATEPAWRAEMGHRAAVRAQPRPQAANPTLSASLRRAYGWQAICRAGQAHPPYGGSRLDRRRRLPRRRLSGGGRRCPIAGAVAPSAQIFADMTRWDGGGSGSGSRRPPRIRRFRSDSAIHGVMSGSCSPGCPACSPPP